MLILMLRVVFRHSLTEVVPCQRGLASDGHKVWIKGLQSLANKERERDNGARDVAGARARTLFGHLVCPFFTGTYAQ